jgi:transcriptional regulator GlxA family with amidase domain
VPQVERKRVGIVLFGDIEVLDFAGPFEVFSVTRLHEENRREEPSPVMLDWLRERAAEAETLTAVCTGSMLLGFAGLLDGLHATTHWRSLDWMRDSFPSVTVEYGKHFVVDGRVFTSAGISAGIDMSLKVVEQYFGEGVARATARHMEYPYPESDARRIAIERM